MHVPPFRSQKSGHRRVKFSDKISTKAGQLCPNFSLVCEDQCTHLEYSGWGSILDGGRGGHGFMISGVIVVSPAIKPWDRVGVLSEN